MPLFYVMSADMISILVNLPQRQRMLLNQGFNINCTALRPRTAVSSQTRPHSSEIFQQGGGKLACRDYLTSFKFVYLTTNLVMLKKARPCTVRVVR